MQSVYSLFSAFLVFPTRPDKRGGTFRDKSGGPQGILFTTAVLAFYIHACVDN